MEQAGRVIVAVEVDGDAAKMTERRPLRSTAVNAGPARRAAGLVSVERKEVCMYYACMPNVQVRDVPEEVHAALVRRAELAGQSLQQFLSAQLAEIAARPTLDEMLERIERRPKGRLSRRDAMEAVDADRARR